MVLATITHLMLGELGAIAPPIVLGAMTAFVAWGRTKRLPIASR